MGYSHKVNRVTMSGTMFGGEEQWSTGFYLGNIAADADAPTDALASAIAALWQTYFTSAGAGISLNYLTTEVKVATLGTDGKTVPDSVHYHTYPTAIAGQRGITTFPAQIALVATMVGPLARGLASKGRMYLPGVCFNVDTNGRINTADRLSSATGIKTFLRGVNDSPLTNNVPLLASQGRKAPLLGDPVMHEIISVRVGNVYDTQRRRRNALTEAYVSIDL